MTILSFCDPKTAMVTTKATVAEAIHVMLACQVGAVAIVDEKNCVAGIFTERDVMTKFALSGRDPADTLTRDLMTAPVRDKNTSHRLLRIHGDDRPDAAGASTGAAVPP